MSASKRHIAAAGSAAHGFSAPESFPERSIGTARRSYGSALGQMFDSTYPAWSVGLTVSYSLGRSYEEAGSARAQVERRQAAQRISSLQLQIAETLRQAVRQVQSTAERIEAARAGTTVARQRLDVEQRRYEVGLVDELSRHAGTARSAADRSEPAAGDARSSVGARQLRSASAGACTRRKPAHRYQRRARTSSQLGPSAPTGLFRPGSTVGF